MSDEHNHVKVTIHAPLPSAEEAAQALFKHARELVADCAAAGWSATLTLTLTKETDRGQDPS